MKVSKLYSKPKKNILALQDPAVLYGSPDAIIGKVRSGISKNYLLRLADDIDFSPKEIARVVHLSERTLQRYDEKQPMGADSSERALQLAQLYANGTRVMGDIDTFKRWMRTPSVIFGGEAPVSLLDTIFGFQWIRQELGRIEHGILA